MKISRDLIERAVESIADVEGFSMNAVSLAEDVLLLSYAFPEEDDFKAACASTCRALVSLVKSEVTPSELKYEFEGWKSYHYQPRIGQGVKATCRIVFRKTESGIEVKGFGHRRIPGDFYKRMSRDR